MGIYGLIKNIRSKTNWFFFLMCIFIAIFTFTNGIAFTTSDYEIFYSITYVKLITLSIYVSLAVKFIIYISKTKQIRKLQILIFTAPCIMILLISIDIRLIFHHEALPILNQFRNILDLTSLWFYLAFLPFTACIMISVGILYNWYKNTKILRQKKQAQILLITYTIGHFLTLIEPLIVNILFRQIRLGLFPIYFLIWNIGVFVALFKYRLFALTPELAGTEIFNQVEDFVFLLDKDYQLLYTNPKAQKSKTLQGESYEGNFFQSLLVENKLDLKLKRLINKENPGFCAKINLTSDTGQSILANARFSLVKDKYDDPLGILVIASELKGIDKLKTIYSISNREVDIIRHVLTGSTNKHIAGQLNITESTVKAHLTSVYNKIGIDNKMQLLNVVLEG